MYYDKARLIMICTARPARSQSHSAVSPSPSNQRRFTEYVSSDDPPFGARAASSEEGSAASPTMTHVLRRRATGPSQIADEALEAVPGEYKFASLR